MAMNGVFAHVKTFENRATSSDGGHLSFVDEMKSASGTAFQFIQNSAMYFLVAWRPARCRAMVWRYDAAVGLIPGDEHFRVAFHTEIRFDDDTSLRIRFQYGYTPDRDAVMKEGHAKNSIHNVKNGVFTRGILIDIEGSAVPRAWHANLCGRP